jgi:hypothetical protein
MEIIIGAIGLALTIFSAVFMFGRKTSSLEGRVGALETRIQQVEEDIDDTLRDIKNDIKEIRADIKTILISKADK